MACFVLSAHPVIFIVVCALFLAGMALVFRLLCPEEPRNSDPDPEPAPAREAGPEQGSGDIALAALETQDGSVAV